MMFSRLIAKYYSIEYAILAHERAEAQRSYSRYIVRLLALERMMFTRQRFAISAAQLTDAFARLGPIVDETAMSFRKFGVLIKEHLDNATKHKL